MHFQPGTDKYGTWFSKTDSMDSWMWRKPASPQLNPEGALMEWPQWAEFVLIEIAGHADAQEHTMGLAAIICAVSNVPTSGKVHGEAYWRGSILRTKKPILRKTLLYLPILPTSPYKNSAFLKYCYTQVWAAVFLKT